MTSLQKGYAYILGFAILTALGYIGIDFVYRNFSISPENAMFWGYLGGIIMGIPFFFTSKKIKLLQETAQLHWKILLGISLLIGIASMLWFWAMSQMSSSIVSLFDKMEVIWALVIGVFALGEKVKRKELLAIGIALVGIFLIATLKGEVSLPAVVVLLGTTFMFATQSFIIKKYGANIHSASLSFLQGWCLMIFTGIVFSFSGSLSLVPFWAFCILGLGQLLSMVIGRRLYFEAHKYLNISRLNVVPLLVPVFVFAIGLIVFPADPLPLQKIIGGVFVIGGLLFFVREHFKNDV